MELRATIKEQEFEEAVLKSNLSYTEIAKKLGITSGYLSNLKNESTPQYSPSASVRRQLLELLGVRFDDIFRIEKGEPKKKEPSKKIGSNSVVA